MSPPKTGIRRLVIAVVWVCILFSFQSIRYSTIGSQKTVDSWISDQPLTHPTGVQFHVSYNSSIPEIREKNLQSTNASQAIVHSTGHNVRPTAPTDSHTNTATQIPRPHPHAGARFANGSWGYVADVTAARRHFLARYYHPNDVVPTLPPRSILPLDRWDDHGVESQEFRNICQKSPREGTEKRAGWRLLSRKVRVVNEDPFQAINERPRLLCAVYTHPKRHSSIHAIVETWGWRCDGFLAASTVTNASWGVVDLPHAGPEGYENMWSKTRSIWAYLYDHYRDDFEYFFLSGDDTHVIVENLLVFLRELGPVAQTAPLYVGHWIPDTKETGRDTPGYFCGGGPGYVVNRKTLEILVRDVLPVCKGDTQVSSEDRLLGYCLRRHAHILGNRSTDMTGAQRFHGMDPNFVASFRGDKGFFQQVYEFWADQSDTDGNKVGFKVGTNITAHHSVSFHLLKTPKALKRHHAVLYQTCPRGTVLGDALAEIYSNSTSA